jgi:pilus assembly protein CpaE
MSDRHNPSIENPVTSCVLVSGNATCGRQLAAALMGQCIVERMDADIDALKERIAVLQPVMVLFDFAAPGTLAASAMVQEIRRAWPELPLLGVGMASDACVTLAALRAGVEDFVDLSTGPDEVIPLVRKFMFRPSQTPPVVKGQLAVLLGARAGLGVSTIAGNLSIVLRELAQPLRPEVALLDMGLPVGDGMLYMDMRSEFSFVDGVRNLKRLDKTLVQTTLSRQTHGVAVLPLPGNLALMRDISHADSVTLVRRLREFFQFQVADFGGFPNVDFIAQVLGSTSDEDRVWVVCDQSLGGLVSTKQLLADLQERGVDTKKFGLIVNRFDLNVELAAKDIASRLNLTLDAVLPARGVALLNAASRGEILAHVNHGDPFVHGVQGMAHRLLLGKASSAQAAHSLPWVQRLSLLTGKWRGGTHGHRD